MDLGRRGDGVKGVGSGMGRDKRSENQKNEWKYAATRDVGNL